MDVLETIKCLAAMLPSDKTGVPLYEHAKSNFTKYIRYLSNIHEDELVLLLKEFGFRGSITKKRFINLMNNINRDLLSILDCVYRGDIHQANDKLNKLLFNMKFGQYLPECIYNTMNFYLPDKKSLYYRIVDLDSNCNKELLIHVPYEIRHKTEKMRFNMSGFPCAYLSNSFECSLSEKSEKGDNRKKYRYILQYKIKSNKYTKSVVFLNMVIPTDEEINLFDNFDKICFILRFPFLFLSLCYSQKKNDNDNNESITEYCDEYFFSQLFFHVIFFENNNLGYFGIAYSSTKQGHRDSVNYVIPAKMGRQLKFNGYSDILSEIFEKNHLKIKKI